MNHPPKLGFLRRSDDHDAVEVSLGVGLVEQRDVDKQPTRRSAYTLCQFPPAMADYWVEDILKRTPVTCIGEDDLAKLYPVRAAIYCKDLCPKYLQDCFPNGVIRRKQIM